MEKAESIQLKFVPFSSRIDLGFWSTLAKRKLEEWKLDKSEKTIFAKYRGQKSKDKASQMVFDIYSFENQSNNNLSGPLEFQIQSSLLNFNTTEEFSKCDFKLEKFDTEFRNYLKNSTFPIFTSYNTENNQIQTIQSYLQGLSNNQENNYALIVDAFNQPHSVNESLFNNFLALVIQYCKVNKIQLKSIKLIILKDFFIYNQQKAFSYTNSIILEVDLSIALINENFEFQITQKEQTIDLRGFMDEKQLASDACDLNIKLMKWRVIPQLNLEKIKETRCLLVGSGTLGCQVSRMLVGWGIRNITFLDNGKVSYSNPVRQTLYTFEDSINGGKPKAETAAFRLKEIMPEINAQGFSIQIPMPGHFITNKEQETETLKTVDFLEQLVSEHDVLFLMTDTRESRWLPTVLANKYNKICITVGLGFDTYVIVRHGMSSKLHDLTTHGERLSCYFCNDIATPADSTKDRTLDQQCTVTRPGLSFLSASYAVELMISLIHHPLGVTCPADEDIKKLKETDLGILPQHIRGSMSDFNTQLFYGSAFENCIACSQFVLSQYEKQRDEFLLKVINDSNYLWEITEISKNLRDIEDTDACIEWDD